MTIDFGQQGFNYTRDLCAAIERYTQEAVQRSADAFHYRGLDLRPAVERRLYILCINSPALFQCYAAGTSRGVDIQQLSAPEMTIAQCLLQTDSTSGFPGWPQLRPIAQRIYGFVRAKLSRQLKLPPLAGPGPDILIHVANPKFTTYLSGVTELLGKARYAYLSTADAGLHEQIREAGHAALHWPDNGANLHSIFVSAALSHFMPLVHEADRLLSALAELRPRCMLTVEGNAPSDALTAETCHYLGIPCFCLQQGWSPYVHSGFRKLRYTEMFVWGPQFAKLLQECNPGQRFTTTGSHVLPQQAPAVRTQGVISFYLQAPCALLGVAAFDAFVELLLTAAQAHPGQSFIVREHPGYPLPESTRARFAMLNNIRFSSPAREPLAEVISASSMVVSVFSTVLLEALPMNAVPLICSIGGMTHYCPDIAGMGAAIEVHSIEEAYEAISAAASDSSSLDRFRQRLPEVASHFFSPVDSSRIIADRLISACMENKKISLLQ